MQLGDMCFHFFRYAIPFPTAMVWVWKTQSDGVIHSGDFKIDPRPLAGSGTDLEAIRAFAGPGGARLLLSDSTNVLRPGRSLTEREVKDFHSKMCSETPRPHCGYPFSSHIQRIQEVFDLAREFDKTVVISGKSLANNIDIAQNLSGFASCRPNFSMPIMACRKLSQKNCPPGNRRPGEPLSALFAHGFWRPQTTCCLRRRYCGDEFKGYPG